MRNWLKRLQIKGFVAGVLVTVLLSGTLLMAAQTLTREITYGINVMLNGEIVQFDEDSRPFVMGGRTFLPLRTLAELLGQPVDFDPATNTAIVGDRLPVGTRRPLNDAVPFHHRGSNIRMDEHHFGASNTAWVAPGTVAMGGREYANALTYQASYTNHGRADATVFTLHNLNGQFRMLTGYVGRIDGWDLTNATFNVFGDGQLLQTHSLNAQDLPIPISIFVEGINLLRIEFVYPWISSQNAGYAFVAFLE